MEHLSKLFVGIAESVRELSEEEKALLEPASAVFQPLKYRTPETIKRDIKHEKNPMRLKQLNQELNMSYKFYKGGK